MPHADLLGPPIPAQTTNGVKRSGVVLLTLLFTEWKAERRASLLGLLATIDVRELNGIPTLAQSTLNVTHAIHVNKSSVYRPPATVSILTKYISRERVSGTVSYPRHEWHPLLPPGCSPVITAFYTGLPIVL